MAKQDEIAYLSKLTENARRAVARNAVRKFGTAEKDMPPAKVVRLGRRVGFRGSRVYPHAHDLSREVYATPSRFLPQLTARWGWFRRLYGLAIRLGCRPS